MSDPSGRPELAGLSAAARHAFGLAEDEARSLGHDRVGTEHVLVGLLAAGRGAAAGILRDSGATLAAVRHKVAETPPAARRPHDGELLPVTPRANRALVRAVRFSHQRHSEEVATSQLLEGVVDVEGTATLILRRLGVDLAALRDAIDSSAATDGDAGARVADDVARTSVPPGQGAVPACPACGVQLALAYTIVPAEGPRGDRDTAVFTCRSCNHVVGVSAARARGDAAPGATALG